MTVQELINQLKKEIMDIQPSKASRQEMTDTLEKILFMKKLEEVYKERV